MKLSLQIERKFDAAHFLRNYDGPCANLHGHTWKVVVKINYNSTFNGIAIDFKVLKKFVDSVLPDHACINDISEFKEKNPTAENLSEYFFKQLTERSTFDIARVEVWESDTACAIAEVE
jgi:6-pyruvoyltetrahydropterin/6-carboxytetrahydropterin synthase